MSILHQGDGHYHLGGDHDHDHDHGHGHGDGMEEMMMEEHHDHDEKKKEPEARRNINVDAAYLHVLGDMLMSIGVIIAATIIYFKEDWKIADPICTYLFSIIVCFTVSKVVKSCVMVLMEGAPEKMDVTAVMNKVD